MTAPICWPTATSMSGSSSVDCVCAGSSTATTHYPTISGASGLSACAYTASRYLPPSITSHPPSPISPDEIICRPNQWWYNKSQLPNTEHYPNNDLENCINDFNDPTKNPTWPADGMMQPGSANTALSLKPKHRVLCTSRFVDTKLPGSNDQREDEYHESNGAVIIVPVFICEYNTEYIQRM